MGLFCEKPASVVSSFLEVIREVLIFTKKTYKMAKLFVYGVNARCPRDILEGEFARCGEVTDVYITEKGYAFITMAIVETAMEAIGVVEAVEAMEVAMVVMVVGMEDKVVMTRDPIRKGFYWL